VKQVLFLSDFHLGIPNYEKSLAREQKICNLLDLYKDKVSDIYFVGDVFDFWFEYKTVVPKGYYRFFGKLAELTDNGIQIHFFKGNHDMWMRDFFKKEFKAKIYSDPVSISISNKKFLIGHGDGLGPGDYKYKALKKFFASSVCQFLYRWIHPDIGMTIASFFSQKSRYSQNQCVETYHGHDREWLYLFAKEKTKSENIDYFVFGHRHLPIYTAIESTSAKYINLGDWLNFDTYAVFDGNELSLYQYGSDKKNLDFSPECNLS
jgi:UDP-2,3-diacylglucosamine hydrolase